MKINTCYTFDLKKQLTGSYDKKTKSLTAWKERNVDAALMRKTADICLQALRCCTDIFLKEWEYLRSFPTVKRKGMPNRFNQAERLIHTTKDNTARYPEFDLLAGNMPSYTRRRIIADALGKVSSYLSNHENWENLSPGIRGSEPGLGLPERYELTFYDQERKLQHLDQGQIALKLFDGTGWNWYFFQLKKSDAAYLTRLVRTRKMLSPTVRKVHRKYRICFCFEEEKALVQDNGKLAYTILGVDLGINAPASWCVMTADGAVHAKGVIHLACEEGRLNRMIARKRMYQQAGKKSRCSYRWVNNANRELSIRTARALTEIAAKYQVNCIVFEYLDCGGEKHGRYRERLHLWRKRDVQKRVELQAHRIGMRVSRVCAWGTSQLAYDGSGKVLRGKAAGLGTYSLCRFKTGKVYNCDLSAAQNIGARFFLREYAKVPGCRTLPATPQRTLCTLRELVCSGLPGMAA